MSELQMTLNNILADKNTNLLPENIKKDVNILGITGTLSDLTQEEYDQAITDMTTLMGGTEYPIVNGDRLVLNIANATVDGDNLIMEVTE